MSDIFNSKQDELFSKLLDKTRGLDRLVTSEDMNNDATMPNPNEYAFYYGSFSVAANKAWCLIQKNEDFVPLIKKDKIKIDQHKVDLMDERTEEIIEEFVDMYIDSGGRMPSKRAIKKNKYISEREIKTLFSSGRLSENVIRKRAEAKTGKQFSSAQDRRDEAMEQIVGQEKLNKDISVVAKELTVMEELKSKQLAVEDKSNKKQPVARANRKHWTKEECQELLLRFYGEFGHMPSQSEVKKSDYLPSWPTLLRQVGPYQNWRSLVDGVQDETEIVETRVGAVEVEIQSDDDDGVMVEATIGIPIKVIVPKWLKGTFKITVSV